MLIDSIDSCPQSMIGFLQRAKVQNVLSWIYMFHRKLDIYNNSRWISRYLNSRTIPIYQWIPPSHPQVSSSSYVKMSLKVWCNLERGLIWLYWTSQHWWKCFSKSDIIWTFWELFWNYCIEQWTSHHRWKCFSRYDIIWIFRKLFWNYCIEHLRAWVQWERELIWTLK